MMKKKTLIMLGCLVYLFILGCYLVYNYLYQFWIDKNEDISYLRQEIYDIMQVQAEVIEIHEKELASLRKPNLKSV